MLHRTGIVILALASISAGALHAEPAATATIVSVAGGSFAENLASREVRRYVYLRTGKLLPIIAPAIAVIFRG